MARRKKTVRVAKKAGKTSSKGGKASDRSERRIQRQYYISRDLIEGLEEVRAEKEAELRKKLGGHIDLTTSQFIGSLIHDLVKAHREKKAKAKAKK